MDRRRRGCVSCAATTTAALAAALAGCVPVAQPIAVDPGVSFAAHLVHAGLVIDTMRGDPRTALVAAPRWLRVRGDPTFVVKHDDRAEAGIWLTGPARAIVRSMASPAAPVIGRVEPDWRNGAIRLTLERPGAPSLRSGVFVRRSLGAGPSRLARYPMLAADVNGVYRALLRRTDGRVVGWLQVAIGWHQPSPVIYEAVLPPGIDEALAAAWATALGDEIDRIEEQTVDGPWGVARP